MESESDLTYWLRLLQGGVSRQDVVQGFWNSQEHRWRQVESYYHDFLGRDLDVNSAINRNERQYWEDRLLFQQFTEADVIRGFVTSSRIPVQAPD